VRVLVVGTYDLFHTGNFLRQAKKAFPSVHLIAGVVGDSDVRKYKGTPVCTEAERYEMLRQCEVCRGVPWFMCDCTVCGQGLPKRGTTVEERNSHWEEAMAFVREMKVPPMILPMIDPNSYKFIDPLRGAPVEPSVLHRAASDV